MNCAPPPRRSLPPRNIHELHATAIRRPGAFAIATQPTSGINES
jgi:hypothetical protein